MNRSSLSWIGAVTFLGVFGFAGFIALQPHHYRSHSGEGGGTAPAHMLLLALYSYANDNGGNYPDGNSSVEVCQKLMADGYVTDPSGFFVSLPGKTKAMPGLQLKPENVCWDFTGGASLKDSGSLPVVFLTGFRVTYAPGAPAVPRAETVPQYRTWPRTWYEWWHGQPVLRTRTDFAGVMVGYANNSARYMPLNLQENSVLKFVPDDFDANGKTYRQLTPDGVLPP